MRRTERLFAIAEYLRGRRTGVTVEQLADRFEVTVRTIHRDLASLRDAALPIHGERGRGGGIALDRAYSLPPVNFNAREAALLLIAGRWIEDFRLLPFTDTLRSALDKIRSALPPRLQRDLVAAMESLSFVGVPALDVAPAVRRAVETAWFEQRPLHIAYEGARGASERLVRIRSVVMERSLTLLNCEDIDLGAPRQFQLHRITSARLASPENAQRLRPDDPG